MDFYIAQGISILTAVVAILSMQMKSMKWVLITQIAANLLASSTYFLLDSFSGAGISLVAIIQLVVMYILNKKEIKPNKILVILFIVMYFVCWIINFKSFMDIFPFLAALCFALGISQDNAKSFRVYGLINPLCWLVYDIYSLALINSIMRVGIFLSGLIAMIRLDNRFKKKSNNK